MALELSPTGKGGTSSPDPVAGTERTTREALLARILADPQLPTLPAVALQVLEKASRLDCKTEELTEIISQDPALCGKVLKVVNSALYNLPRPVSSLGRAVGLMGLNAVRSLVLALSLPAVQARGPKQPLLQEFWRASVAGAVVARDLAVRLRWPCPEDDFVAGLLRDLGILILLQTFPENYPVLVRQAAEGPSSLQCDLERQAFGLDHAEVSACLLSDWRLPAELTEPIRHHHAPAADAVPQAWAGRAALLSFADLVARLQSGASPVLAREVRELAEKHYQLDERQLAEFLGPVARKASEFAAIAQLDIGACEDYSRLLVQAAEALVKLTVESSLDGLRVREQKQQAEQEARRLRQVALRDALTGAYNRGFFEDDLRVKFRRAQRRCTILGLVFLDLDGFKQLNDTFGHPFGDRVLKEVTARLLGSVRGGDVVARYGGDEFCVLVENTNEEGLQVLAHRLWRAVNALTIRAGERIAGVGASVGSVACLPRAFSGSAQDLLAAADRAMYQAKGTGRNRITSVSLFHPEDRAFLYEISRRLFSAYLSSREGVRLPELPLPRTTNRFGTPGRLVRRLGWVGRKQLRAILLEQRRSRRPFEEVALTLGLLSPAELLSLLSIQQERPEELAQHLVGRDVLDESAARACVQRYYRVVRLLAPLSSRLPGLRNP